MVTSVVDFTLVILAVLTASHCSSVVTVGWSGRPLAALISNSADCLSQSSLVAVTLYLPTPKPEISPVVLSTVAVTVVLVAVLIKV